jgi:NodT family efflux transporter outer membrane factor (OMF) lipoprotein
MISVGGRSGPEDEEKVENVLLSTIAFIAAIASVVITGCAVGPDFHSPEAPAVNSYTAEALPPETASAPGVAGAAQRLIPGREIPEAWWTLFHSAALDSLIREALAANPTLAAAEATLRQSQENYRALVGSALFPSVNADASVTRQKISGAAVGQPNARFDPFTLYSASVGVTYALDVTGGARRELESLRSQVDYERFLVEGAYLTITANIVTTAINEAALRAELGATSEIIQAQEKQLDVMERQFQLGAVAKTDVLAQRSQLAQTRATLPPLEKALSQTRHLLAVLAGKLPSEAAALPGFSIDGFELPQEVPVSLPSSLVRQRPDIRAAESLMHAASAQIGVATAALLPQITLTGSFGSEASRSGSLFTGGAGVWSLGAGLLQPLFHGGELSAKHRAAAAAYDSAAAQYRATVLQAFQNVADVLRALEADANSLKARAEAEASARELLDMAQKQFQLGAVSYLSLLNAERQFQQSRISVVQAQAARFADTAALFKALGGGWWNRTGHADTRYPPGSELDSDFPAETAAGKKE